MHTLGSGYILIALHLILTGDSVYVLYFTYCIDQVLFEQLTLNYWTIWTVELLNTWTYGTYYLSACFTENHFHNDLFIKHFVNGIEQTVTFERLFWTNFWTIYELAKLTSYFCSWYFHLCFSGSHALAVNECPYMLMWMPILVIIWMPTCCLDVFICLDAYLKNVQLVYLSYVFI